MRDRTAVALFVTASVVAVVGFSVLTADVPSEDAPDVTFAVETDAAAGELVVEHAAGEALDPGSLRILVYEDRAILPDRTVHGTVWDDGPGTIRPGDRIELEDRRFEPGQRVVVRWFGDAGQATLYETTMR